MNYFNNIIISFRFFLMYLLSGICGIYSTQCTYGVDQSCKQAAALEGLSEEELRQKADAVMRLADNVEARKQIRAVWDFVDQLTAKGKSDDAISYIEFGLQHDPWNLTYQIQYAELMQKRGQREQAIEKANLVQINAERDVLINRARILLGQETIPKISTFSKIEEAGPSIVIVPIGEVEVWLVWELKRSLENSLGVSVHIRDASIVLPPYRRDRYHRIVESMRKKILDDVQNPEIQSVLREKKADTSSLQKDDLVVDVIRSMIQKENAYKVREFDIFLANSKGKDPQWDIEELSALLQKQVIPFKTSNQYYLGIAGVDAYLKDSNFIFGSGDSSTQCGVITYRRFTAEFNETPPNPKRLLSRTHKQALSTTGFLFGVPRCTSPNCARAYPHSLDEHDAKSETLCETCKKKFNEKLGLQAEKL